VNRRTLGCLFELLETFLVILVVLLITQLFVAQPYQVQSHTMDNTLAPGQFVLVDKISPRFDDFHRSDIVVFNLPSASAAAKSVTPEIERVIGVAGDTVDIHGGHVYVNATQATEIYVAENQTTDMPGGGSKVWKLTSGQLFVMGDNRKDSASHDSRAFGPIDSSSVVGRAWLRYWPFGKFGLIPPAQQPPAPSGSPVPSIAP
jgi:signal peptidase I